MNDFRKRAQTLRSSQTDAEARLWYRLRAGRLEGWKFRRQVPIDRYIVDFVCMPARLIVEVDGATHSTDAERRYDDERTAALRQLGFQITRFNNSDVYDHLDAVLAVLLAELRRLPPPPPEGEVDGEAGGRGFTAFPERT